ncbi:hypothetical protein D9C73_011182 [Collichthys lucidus]|uniref:Uncharacterized protein n=1 Tax=Collichthys lucidus TaxID=240159 RepID=A0A4U5URF5_COLLU|nr:hypothetical protein D9C73_011182 [Collichthys lucidus]
MYAPQTRADNLAVTLRDKKLDLELTRGGMGSPAAGWLIEEHAPFGCWLRPRLLLGSCSFDKGSKTGDKSVVIYTTQAAQTHRCALLGFQAQTTKSPGFHGSTRFHQVAN